MFVLTLMNISKAITPKKGEIVPISFDSITDGPKKSFKTVPGHFVKEFITEFELC
jgi:hypothetical protein